MELFGCHVKPRHELIARFPDIEHVLHVAHTVKTLVQADYIRDVIRVGSALEESGAHDGVVRIGLFKLKASPAETHRYHDRILIADEMRFGTGFRKPQ